MRDLTRYFAASTCALGLVVLAPAACHAQNVGDADKREISAYRLTEAGLGKYLQATRHLKGLKIDSAPGATAAVQSASMTTREYVVFTFSLMQNGLAAWALDQPGGELPPGVSQPNVDFFRAHQADMQEMGDESDDSTCGDGVEDENGE